MTPTGLADGLEVGSPRPPRPSYLLGFDEFAPWRADRAGGSPASPCGVLGVRFESGPVASTSQLVHSNGEISTTLALLQVLGGGGIVRPRHPAWVRAASRVSLPGWFVCRLSRCAYTPRSGSSCRASVLAARSAETPRVTPATVGIATHPSTIEEIVELID